MINTSVNGVDEQTAPIGASSIYEGNITQNGTWDLTNGVNSNQTVASGLLVAGPNFYQVTAGSPAINAGIGSYPFLTNDFIYGTRDSNIDAGAEEFGGNGTFLPYTVADVGNAVGFVPLQASFLNASTTAINYNVSGDAVNFDVNSNISWSISGNPSWLTLTPANGSDNAIITATATTNATGAERTGIITITEDGGSLSHTINVTQSDTTFDPNNEAVAIAGTTVTGVGTQVPNIPENTIDGIVTTRWSDLFS